MIYPIRMLHHKIQTQWHFWCTIIQTNNTYINRIADLQKQIDTLQAESIKLNAVITYIEETEDLQLFKQTFDHADDIIAHIIGWYITPQEHYIIINKGSSSGIHADMIVHYNNMILGRTIEVFPWYTKVQCITDPKSCIPAYMAHSDTHGICQGIGLADEMDLAWVSHLQEVNVGDKVITSGEGLIYPCGYMLGTVIDKKPIGLYYAIKVKHAIDPRAVSYCLIHDRKQ
ncbi:MAG TPA: rod shape-determining protein MreC [Candidatus Babeliales bacterium]|nr:rod shape-determining protein MreC [Candidatus Babeliales bacterium]